MRGPIYLGLTRSISLRRQVISSHDIDYVEYVVPGLTWGRILGTCVISMWSNGIKCKYMFMFPLNNLARKGLFWTNGGILLIWPLWTNFNEIGIKIQQLPFTKMSLKMLSAKRWPFCSGLNVLIWSSFQLHRSRRSSGKPLHIGWLRHVSRLKRWTTMRQSVITIFFSPKAI